MRSARQSGFTIIELLAVIAIVSLVAVVGWGALQGWQERNALRMVSQDVKYLFEKYRQRAVDKGYNYGLIFSDDGIYVFEDNGGSSSDRFRSINNFAVDPGEYSDQTVVFEDSNLRASRRVSSAVNEFKMFSDKNRLGHVLVMTTNSLDLDSSHSGRAYEASGADITSQAKIPFMSGDDSPFESGSLALFFSPDGCVYLKDPTVSASPLDKHQYRLGNGTDAFYVVRVAYDNPDTSTAELPNYYEIAVNRYGATTYVRWETNNGGTSWNAHIQ